MKSGHASLLSLLSDGEIHSGETLAQQQNISRAAVWKSIKQLESYGLIIEAERGQGYRLKRPIELLSVENIKKLLPSEIARVFQEINVLFKTHSTNSVLFNRLHSKQIHGHVVFAEYQSEGRGRRGNQWFAPLGSGLMFSLGWHFDVVPNTMSLLSLFIGVAVARTLRSENIKCPCLKWPNDIVVDKKKIGGVLIEVRGEAGGPIDVVIGIGINYELPRETYSLINQPITDICSHADENTSRNKIAATLLANLFEVLKQIEVGECNDLLNEWRTLDCYTGQQVKLILPNEEIEGIIKGVDEQGALLMSVNGDIKHFNAGEISLRVLS